MFEGSRRDASAAKAPAEISIRTAPGNAPKPIRLFDRLRLPA